MTQPISFGPAPVPVPADVQTKAARDALENANAAAQAVGGGPQAAPVAAGPLQAVGRGVKVELLAQNEGLRVTGLTIPNSTGVLAIVENSAGAVAVAFIPKHS